MVSLKTGITTWVYRDQYLGFRTFKDPEKVEPGSIVAGYNVSFNRGDLIQARPLGFEGYPVASTIDAGTDPIISVHTFRKRDGTNLMMRSYLTLLQYFDETSAVWVTIKGGYTTGQVFGFADYNINTDQHSYVYFCNAVEAYSRWSGDITNLTADLNPSDVTVTVADTTGFAATGNITINGTVTAYSALTATTFTIGAWGGALVASGSAITSSPTEYASAPKGNIITTYNNRIFVAGILATPQAVYFSKYGDATDFTSAALVTESTADAPGIFNLAEGGGGVIGYNRDEQALYIIKPTIIYVVTLSDSLYTLEPLKPFDGKSQTTGGIATRTCFSTGNGVIFITPDKKIYYLTRLQFVDYPQLTPISDDIYPTINELDFTSAAGITFREQVFIACSSAIGGINDVVLVYNLVAKQWETPITGWNVADWLIYNNGDGDELFFASNNSTNVFLVTTSPVDGSFDVSSLALMNQETFGAPAEQKFIDNAFFEGYIAENTDPLTITLYFNDEGYTQTLSATISGNNTDILFFTDSLNVFGLNPFGIEMFGSNPDQSGRRKFRVYTKNTLRTTPFYNIQIGFSASGQNQDWSVINYGFSVGIYENPQNRNLYIGFE